VKPINYVELSIENEKVDEAMRCAEVSTKDRTQTCRKMTKFKL